MTYAGNVHPYIRFDNSDSSQNISLIFTDYDSYRRPAGIKLIGNQGNEWFEAANIYATTFYGALSGNSSTATKLQTSRTIWGQSFDGTGNVDNTLRIRQTTGNYCEGIRIQTADGAWSTIILGATADSGTNTNAWSIHRKADNNFAISRNSSDGVNGLVMTSTGMGLGTTTPTHRLDVRGDTKITGSIRDLAIGGGIYWNPYVESTTDNSDAASITVVKSGVAGGTTLVLSQMNDANDTIQFKTNGSARLYHNSYPILTTQNTYVSNNKGYINGAEITQVNNADKVDNRHAISTTPNTGIIYKAAIYTSSSLTSYWVRLASIPSISQNAEFIATIHVQSGHSNPGRSAILLVYLRGSASSFMSKSFKIYCNSNYDPNRFRLYYKDSDKTSEIWYQTTGQWDGIITTVISQSSEGSLYEGLTLYSGSITAVQTPSMNTYLSAQVSTITDNILGNAATATKLQTARSIWGHSFNGTADVNGTIYINNNNSSEGAIRLNNNINSNARISAIDSQVIFNTDAAIRFGGTSWDQNVWAGLKYTHSNKTIYLGIADGSVFNANSAQSGGSLRFPGISNVYATTFNGSLSGNASTATTLQTTRTLWGQSFNGSANVSGNMSGVGQITFSTLTGTNGRALLYQQMADNDYFRIYVGGTASNSGYVEIATADDGNEPIYVRQYTGVFSTIKRTFTLLDGSGNTILPGLATATGFKKNGSTDNYVLLGGGGHKIISDFMLKGNELSTNLTTISKSLTVTQAWMDTGIKNTDLPANGTYIVQVSANNTADSIWSNYWSGIMSWYIGGTNDNEADEIILHRAGHAYHHTIYLRTIMTTSSDGRHLRLQIAADTNLSTAVTYTFKFKRVI